jgi:uncharacterized protein YkwD
MAPFRPLARSARSTPAGPTPGRPTPADPSPTRTPAAGAPGPRAPLPRRGRGRAGGLATAGALATVAVSSLAASAPAASAATCAGADRTIASQGATKAEAAVRCLVNQRRTAAGLKPLTANAKAATAAQRHTDDMVRKRYFDHVSPSGSTVADRVNATGLAWTSIGENIAIGQRTPAAVMSGWMKSAGHRANIMNRRFTVIGVGVNRKGTKGYSGPTWTQVFARTT